MIERVATWRASPAEQDGARSVGHSPLRGDSWHQGLPIPAPASGWWTP